MEIRDPRDEDPAAPGGAPSLALDLARSGSAGAETFLEEQTKLTRLQIEDLKREDRLRHWSLRVRHVSDVLKLSFELAIALILIAIVTVIAGALWSAAHDDGLVIDAFKVPPDMASRGLTGDVVAASLLDRLITLQDATDSSRAPNTYSSNWGSGIKVEIPNTGISIDEAYRYLAGWLGHQTHISGEVYRTASGIALVARVSGETGARFQGQETDLDKLVDGAARAVYRRTQPFRYAVYLSAIGDARAQDAVLRDLALNGPDSEKPWAYAVWAFLPLSSNDMATALARSQRAVELAPDHALALDNLTIMQALLGQEEQELETNRRTVQVAEDPGQRWLTPRAAKVIALQTKEALAGQLGDWQAALAANNELQAVPDFEGSHWAANYLAAADLALLHEVSASRAYPGRRSDGEVVGLAKSSYGWSIADFRLPQFEEAMALGDWRAARTDYQAIVGSSAASVALTKSVVVNLVSPWLALAQAEAGDLARAERTIAPLPQDSYLAERIRGRIATLKKDWPKAAWHFAHAIRLAPSIPFAYAEWGEMLMRKGDLDGAIAKFAVANRKGPHFADPLEMWGEALIGKNRSELAVAKFDEAAKHAPNWGRLHLKWGEALLWSGDKAGAAKQFATAARLDLSPSEKSQLVKVRAHG